MHVERWSWEGVESILVNNSHDVISMGKFYRNLRLKELHVGATEM